MEYGGIQSDVIWLFKLNMREIISEYLLVILTTICSLIMLPFVTNELKKVVIDLIIKIIWKR